MSKPDWKLIGLVTVIVACFIATGWFLAAIWPKAMTNDQIIKETHKCQAAGMKPDQIQNGWTYEVVRVQCEVKS